MATFEKRLQSDDTVRFRTKIRIKGVPTQSASFPRLTDARRWAQGIEAAIRRGVCSKFRVKAYRVNIYGTAVGVIGWVLDVLVIGS